MAPTQIQVPTIDQLREFGDEVTKNAREISEQVTTNVREFGDEVTKNAREISEQLTANARKLGEQYADLVKEGSDRAVNLERKLAGSTDQEWLATLINNSADFTREASDAYVRGVRSLIK